MGAGEELGSLMVTGEGPGIPTESSEEPNGLTDMAEEVCGMMANVEELDCPRFAGEVPGNVTDTSDDPANATDNGGIPGNVTDTGGIPGNVTDTGEVPGNAMVTGEVPGNAKDTEEVPGNAMDTDNPGNATDISDDPGNAMETGEAPGSPTDTAEEPKSPTEMGKETVEPMDNNERSSDLDGSGKIACGFDSILEMVSGPAGRNGTSAVMGKRAGAPCTGMDCGLLAVGMHSVVVLSEGLCPAALLVWWRHPGASWTLAKQAAATAIVVQWPAALCLTEGYCAAQRATVCPLWALPGVEGSPGTLQLVRERLVGQWVALQYSGVVLLMGNNPAVQPEAPGHSVSVAGHKALPFHYVPHVDGD